MISHALSIIRKELQAHLSDVYVNVPSDKVQLGNLSEGLGTGGNGSPVVPRDKLVLSLVNYREDNALKNGPHYVRNDIALTATYENPPVFLNFLIMVSATHGNYTNALTDLSRAIRFFQARRVFTQNDVDPASLIASELDATDLLTSFKLIFDIYSPSLEEVNHLWGTLGGKQYPFFLYVMRMLDLKFRWVQRESGLISEVDSRFAHKQPVGT